jgi:phenylpyruvate tautomerase PptA (4-oxalocrotonate tautomerase family)
MPLIHISLRAGKPDTYRQAIFDSLYRAMRETLDVPEGDEFMTISEHDATNFRYGAAFGVARSDDLVYIQITVFNSRTAEQKKALFRRNVEHVLDVAFQIDRRVGEMRPLAKTGVGRGEQTVPGGLHQRMHLLPCPSPRPGTVADKKGFGRNGIHWSASIAIIVEELRLGIVPAHVVV